MNFTPQQKPLAVWRASAKPQAAFVLPSLLWRHGHDDVGVAPLDRVGRAARPRHDPLHDRPAVDARLADDQRVDVEGEALAILLVLGVGGGALDDLLQES